MKNFKEDISYFLDNKLYMGVLLSVAVAAYGYEITHSVVGVDDICIDRYFEEGLGITIGRWPFFVFNQLGILGIDTYIPFLADFLAVVILVLVCAGWCALFKRILDRNFLTVSIWCYIVFSVFFISYSLIAYVFIFYLHNGVALGHLCIIADLFLWDDIHYNRKHIVKKTALIMGTLTLAISFYESFAPVFIMAIYIWEGVNECFRKSSLFEYIKRLLYMCVILGTAILGRKIISVKLADIYPRPLRMREAKIAGLFEAPISDVIQNIQSVLRINYETYIENIHSNSVFLLDIAIVIIVLNAIYQGVKKKNIFHLCDAVIGILSLFIISIYSGEQLFERSTQNMPLLIGFAFSVLVYYVANKKVLTKIAVIGAIVILEWNNLCVMNFLFYSEAKNNENSITVLKNIGDSILQVGNGKKAVAFIGGISEREIAFDNNLKSEYLTINQGILGWGAVAFDKNGSELISFLRLNGYDFYKASEEQLIEAREIASGLPSYPEEGYIIPCKDYVIVKLGESGE